MGQALIRVSHKRFNNLIILPLFEETSNNMNYRASESRAKFTLTMPSVADNA